MKAIPLLPLLALSGFADESIKRHAPELDELIAPDATIETLATGFDWAEGPVWDKTNQHLLFSDVPRNTIYQWPAGETQAADAKGVSVFMHPSGFTGVSDSLREPGSNGLAFDSKGRLLCCEHGDRRVSVLTTDGGKRTLADNYQGQRFNSPNDLAVHSSGAIYFTDPPYGLPKDPASRELPFCGVFRIAPDGKVSLLTTELNRPNGIALSPDESILYVAQSDGKAPTITAYPLQPDGNIGGGRVFFDTKPLRPSGPGGPDGLKVHPSGTIFATGPGGVLVIDAKGRLLGQILTGRRTANLAFGGNKDRYLFITADDRLLRVKLQ